jgi:tRNA (guanine37-N1)-methyltransferase
MTESVVALKQFGFISIFPEMLSGLTEWGVTGRAARDQLFTVETVDPRQFATDKHGTVDDRPYGGGPGMVMKAPILSQSVHKAKHKAIIFVAGRYEGFDERFLEQDVDLELSVGDMVVSGGEMPAMLVMDSLIRRIPGVLGDEMSAEQDSFVDGLLDCPHYTRPEIFEGRAVPEVLLSGDHARIADWRAAQALKRTLDRRPDLLDWADLTDEQRAMLARWDLNVHL